MIDRSQVKAPLCLDMKISWDWFAHKHEYEQNVINDEHKND